MDTTTALTVAQRASVALGAAEHEKKLLELAKQSTEIVAITNTAGYQQCHASRMALKNARVSIEKTGKAAREDATAFSKAVIAEEKRLIQIIEPEEVRLQAIQDAHDAKVETERQAKIKAEEERMARIQAMVQAIKDIPASMIGKHSDFITGAIDRLREREIGAEFEEFQGSAIAARDAAVVTLQEMCGKAKVHEAEQEHIQKEREELARLRAEQDERTRQEAIRIAEDARKQAEARARIEAEEQAARDRIAAQEKEARERLEAEERRQQAERDRIAAAAREIEDRQRAEREAIEAKARAEREAAEARDRDERLAKEQREREEREARDLAERQERERVEAEKRARDDEERARQIEAQRVENEKLAARDMATKFCERFDALPEWAPAIKALRLCLAPRSKSTTKRHAALSQ